MNHITNSLNLIGFAIRLATKKPYHYGNYSWTKCNKNRKYVQVLQYIWNNPNCTRTEIINAIWNKFIAINGYQSQLFSHMIFDNLIDYDKKYRYTITSKGLEILKNCKD